MKNLMKMFSVLLIIFLFTFYIAKGQTWTHYTTADGLAADEVRSIAIDANGNKWFGTYNGGVSKFDGINWTTYTTADGLFNNTIRYIYVDKSGSVWVASGLGGYGLDKYDGSIWTAYDSVLTGNPVTSIAQDIYGNMWFGAAFGGVIKFDGNNWTTYTITNGFLDDCITSIATDFQGNVWCGTFNNGIAKFDGVNWTRYIVTSGLNCNLVNSIAIDAQNNLWSTPHDNFYLISKYDGISWNSYPVPYIGTWTSVMSDNQNNIWLYNQYGVVKFDGLTWTYYTYASYFNVESMAIDYEGNKWFGTSDGVLELSDGGPGPLNLSCIISGSIFYDVNENGILDNGETKLQGKMVEVLNDSTFATTQSNGNFYIARDSGSYQLKCISNNYWNFSTDSIIIVTVSDTSTFIDNINFGIYLRDSISDVSVDITGNEARAGFTVPYWLTYKNEASVTKSGTVVLTIDPLTTFISSTPSPDLQNGNVITWNYSNLVPFEQRQIHLQLQMPGVGQLGQTITTTAIINPVPGDVLPLNNYDTLRQVITGSFDPNDKGVDKGIKEQGYTLMDEELTYTVRFQNTGTDTAITVQIRDTIDCDMDMQTLRIVSASHEVRLDVKNQNVVTFIFENILLPDSGASEEASSGFIKFALQPKPDLPEYTEVFNKAYIYFDFNPAVITNQVLNTYVNNPASGVEAITVDEPLINLYPNPASNLLNIETGQPMQIEILNLQGQIIKRFKTNEGQTSIDVSGFPAGLYFLKAATENNISVKKFIKE
jgi:uncharacterized repeat protein (TIGR01451 family)